MTYRSVNALFTSFCVAFSTIVGSLVSFVWHGGALWCVFEIVSGRRKLSPDRPMRAIAILFAIFVAANLVSFALNFTALSDLYYFMPLVTFLLLPFSYSVWSISEKDQVARACVVGSAVACYGALVLAVLQVHFLSMRAEGGAGNALVFAEMCAVTASICLAAALGGEGTGRRWLLGAFAAGLLAILYSGSRTIWGVIVVDMAIVAWVYRRELRRLLSPRTVAAVAGAVVLIALLALPLVRDRVDALADDWTAFSTGSNYDTSLGVRLALWQIGAELFVAHPFAGYGIQATHDLVRENLLARFGVSASYSHFHNGFLTLLVEAGIVGAAAVAAVFVVAAATGVRTLRRATGEIERLGGTILLVLVATYLLSGGVNKLLGHDILDTMLLVFLTLGIYLAAGTSMAGAQGKGVQPDEMKRVVDLLLAVPLLIVASPFLLAAMVAIRLGSPGPAIYAQQRLGRGGVPFRCLKLRTMYADTPSLPTHEVSARSVTPVGRFLRRFKLDELPQLWNVVRGEMSVVGPRPCLPTQEELARLRRALGVFDILPGITGLAQVSGIDMSDPQACAGTDADYARRRSLTLDLRIVLRTLFPGGNDI